MTQIDRIAGIRIELDDFDPAIWRRVEVPLTTSLEGLHEDVSLQLAARGRSDLRLIHPDEMVATFPDQTSTERNPFALRVSLSDRGTMYEIAVIPDLIFGLLFADGSRRNFVVEIDRGTMPVTRADSRQTSFERKMRGYLTAHAAKEHERHFGWKSFRVLTATTDHYRVRSMKETLRQLHVPRSAGPSLFLFCDSRELGVSDPLAHAWSDGTGREARLV
jgi:hypothetical protein